MDSDKSDDEEQDVISKQIVDYYKKYSQSRHLPKYFSGTSLSYMPPIVKEDEIVTKPAPIIVIDSTETSTQEAPLEAEEPKQTSPTSSITSNRKLEWDNGADIGYSNYEKSKLHKSLSLPTLTDSVPKITKPKLQSQIITVISYSSPDEQKSRSSSSEALQNPVSSSSSYSEAPQKQVSSSSSSCQIQEPVIQSTRSTGAKPPSSSSSLSFLKHKIGSPEAESTPKITQGLSKKSVFKNNITLCVTKPILIQCHDDKKRGTDKKIQTSISEGLSKCVQTGSSLEIVTPRKSPEQNQSVIVLQYESDLKSSSSGGLVASHCDSFEYFRENRERSVPNLVASSDSSKDLPLSQIITEKQSNNLIDDIDRSIKLLQKLLKSKKYDPVTKKRYIRKIVDKIVDNKYDDSTTSSELFVPKKQQKLEENIPWCPPQLSKFTVKTFNEEFLPQKSVLSGGSGDSLENQQNSSSGSYQSWKEDKTLSEKLHEEKQNGQGDHLVKFAMKERQHQLSWIKDEISHLTKLKGLLEKKVQRTTTVYMLSHRYNKSDDDLCDCSDSQSSSTRNYVIQTELSTTTSSSDLPTEYNVRDKFGERNYQVKELSEKGERREMGRNVVGDIEVESDGKTTSIKVKTKKFDGEFKPKEPTLVGAGKYDTYPQSKAEERKNRGILKKGTRTDVEENTQQISIEIPLEQLTQNLPQAFNDFPHECTCRCQCMEIVKNVLTERNKRTRFLLDSKSDEKISKSTESIDKPYLKAARFQTGLDFPEDAKTSTEPTDKPYFKRPKIQAKSDFPDQKLREKNSTEPDDKHYFKAPKIQRKPDFPDSKVGEKSSTEPSDQLYLKTPKIQKKSEFLDSKIGEKSSTKPSDQTPKIPKKSDFSDPKINEKSSTEPSDKLYLKRPKIQAKSDSPDSEIDENSSTEPVDKLYLKRSKIQTKPDFPDLKTDEKTGTRPILKPCLKFKECQTASDTDSACICKKVIDIEIQTEDAKSEPEICKCWRNQQVQTSDIDKYFSDQSKSDTTTSSTSSSDSSTYDTSNSVTESYQSCICCKRKNVKEKNLYELRKKLSDEAYPLCRPCFKQNRRLEYSQNYYTNPGHVCNCYTVVETKTLNEIKKTINDLNELEEYCTCTRGNDRKKSEYCKYCQCKLKKTSKNKNGIAYLLTFDETLTKEDKKKRKKKKALEEIKIKIPVAHKKKHKDKENKRKKASQEYESEASTSDNPKKSGASLNEYLRQNRPEFVEGAESRRKTVNDSRKEREQMSDHKKLKFLKKYEESDKNAKRLFSAKEMKDINKRNYKKLPEVQQKLLDNKEKKLRQASRLMADTFNRKLRENVLKGKKDLPTDVHVINL